MQLQQVVNALVHPPEAATIQTYMRQLGEFEAQTKTFRFTCIKSEHALPQKQGVVREGEVTVDGATAWLVLREGCLQCFKGKDKADQVWRVNLAKEAAAVRAVELQGEALVVGLAKAVEVEEEHEVLTEDGGCCCWGAKQTKEKVKRKRKVIKSISTHQI